MCLGGGGGPSRELTGAEKDAQKLALQDLKTRQNFLPLVFRRSGYELGPDNAVTQLPPSQEEQMMQALSRQGFQTAGEAGDAIGQRLRASQAMLPGLLQSVQASMAPGISAYSAPQWAQGQGMPNPSSMPYQGSTTFQDLLKQLQGMN